jgi:hypothetical protein
MKKGNMQKREKQEQTLGQNETKGEQGENQKTIDTNANIYETDSRDSSKSIYLRPFDCRSLGLRMRVAEGQLLLFDYSGRRLLLT